MKKNIITGNFVKMLMTCFMIIFIFVFADCKKINQENTENGLQTTLTFVKGSVMINEKKARTGDIIENVVTISTGESSLCEIMFGKNNIIQFQSNTIATLNFESLVKEVELKTGSIASILKGLEQNPEKDSFRVRSNTTVAGVRGTTFFVQTDGKKTYVCDCNGSVNVSDLDNKHSELLKNLHHGARVFLMVNGKLKVEEGSLQYHDDKMMADLATKIGYKLDWQKLD
ncbi:MAG: FecR family protein [Spirochaetia bacterium]|nr:FecR family protein [Spirochaetia bacterium]